MPIQDACIQNVAFHDVRLYDDALLHDATMYDAVLNCIMLQGLIILYETEFHDAALHMMLHCKMR